MNLSWIRLLLFVAAGGFGLAAIAWTDRPRDSASVDRHTGRSLEPGIAEGPAPSSLDEPDAERIIEKLRAVGDARRAHEALSRVKEEFADPEALREVEKLLAAELAALEDALEPEAEEERAAALEVLRSRLSGPLPPEAALPLLATLQADGEIARATEGFFQGLVGDRRLPYRELAAAVAAYRPCDLVAALAIASADGEPGRVPARTCLLVARSFRAADRPRARLRWLLRGVAADPASRETALVLARAYLEYGRQPEALTVLGTALSSGLDSPDVWELRSRVAGWLSIPAAEAGALEALIRNEEDLDHRRRLIALYTFLGTPGNALTHAVRLAEAEGGPDPLASAARLAFEAGLLDDAFHLLERAVGAAEDPRPWRELLVRCYLQDLRFEAATEGLYALHRDYPDGGYDLQLESLLRRRGRLEELTELLLDRLARRPDPKLEEEILGLCAGLGRMPDIRRILTRRIEGNANPKLFFNDLPLYRTVDLPGLPKRAIEMVRSPDLDLADVPAVVATLTELSEDPGFLYAARILAARFRRLAAVNDLQVGLLDLEKTPEEAARAAERLAKEQPENDLILRAWIERASWAGLIESEIRAREQWLARYPEEAGSRRRLAELLEAAGRPGDAAKAWRALAERDGIGSAAEVRWIESLRAAGREDEALKALLLQSRIPGLPVEDRSRLAEAFFEVRWMDVALALFEGVLEELPEDRRALLRVGQLRAWANDPTGSIPYFEKLLGIAGPGDGEVLYLLGEALFACNRKGEGREAQKRALSLLRRAGSTTTPRESMIGKILARMGRTDEARFIFARLVLLDPANLDLLLDYADTMAVADAFDEAREIVTRAGRLGPNDRRLLRMDGQLLIEEERYEEAVGVLRRGLYLHGPDAGYESDLARALTPAGYWRDAREAFARSLALQPGNRLVAWEKRGLDDRLAPLTVEIQSYLRAVGDDSAYGVRAEGCILLDRERIHLTAVIEQSWYSGRAAAVADGAEDVKAHPTSLGLGLAWRAGSRWSLGAGTDFYVGRPDAGAVGGWSSVQYQEWKPYWSVELRTHVNEPLREPAAAMGLGGASSGASIDAYVEGAKGAWWVAGRALGHVLTLEDPVKGGLRDGWLGIELVAGIRLTDQGPQIQEGVRPRRSPALLTGTTSAGELPGEEGTRACAWLGYSRLRLRGDRELADSLPLGEQFEYVTATARAEGRVADGLFYEVEGYLGTDLKDPGLFAGATLGLACRPEPGFEFRLRGHYGRALGRDEEEEATSLELAMTLRW